MRVLRFILGSLALLAAAISPAGAQTRATVVAACNTLLPTNGVGKITAAALRSCLDQEIAANAYLGDTNVFAGSNTFSNLTYSALFTGGPVGIGTTTPNEALVVKSGALQVLGNITTFNPSSADIDVSGAYARFVSFGADASTLGGFIFSQDSSNGSLNNIPMQINPTGVTPVGAVQFTATAAGIYVTGSPSSVITGNIFGGGPLEHYGVLDQLTAALPTNPEIGLGVSITSAVGAGNVSYYKVAAGFNMVESAGSAPAWAWTSVNSCGASLGDIQCTTGELDLNNNNKNYTQAMAALGHSAVNLVIAGTNAGGYASAGIVIAFGGSPTLPMWDYGIELGIAGFKTFNTAAIVDTSSATTSYQLGGIHTTGLDLTGCTCTFAINTANNQHSLSSVTTGATVVNLVFLDASNLEQIGGAGTNGFRFNGNSQGGVFVGITNSHATAGDYGIQLQLGTPTAVDATSIYMNFVNPANTVQRGSISANDSAGVGHVAYNTTSDQTLKRDLGLVTGALPRLMRVRVHEYVGKDYVGPERDDGFFAQELEGVYPHAVTLPGYGLGGVWQVDYGRMTPLLTSAVQDQQREIEALTVRVRALERTRIKR